MYRLEVAGHIDIKPIKSTFPRHKKAAQKLAETFPHENGKKSFAQFFCHHVILSYWRKIVDDNDFSPPSFGLEENAAFEDATADLAHEIGLLLSPLSIDQSGYLMGSLYTSLLPPKYRARMGAYYTPPILAKRLINNLSRLGLDWKSCKILDPACGGAAFLAPLATHTLNLFKESPGFHPDRTLDKIIENMHGYEIDPFAAWMSQTLLEIALRDLCRTTNRHLPSLVKTIDSIALPEDEYSEFDLVIGNPPYGRTGLNEALRHKYSRSLYGHANLYGLFTDLAVRLTRNGGYIAFVTPTSFLGGQYFKSLRKLLSTEAPPCIIDFINDRSGVFENVLQETALVIFRKMSGSTRKTTINHVKTNNSRNSLEIEKIGKFGLPSRNEAPWIFSRSKEQNRTVGKALQMRQRLSSYGFVVNTGQLVWNRHKDQLTDKEENDAYPLIWAESILTNGSFRFRADRNNHKPYFKLKPSQGHLLTREPCVLVQRTTAKEQYKRLVSAVLPDEFLIEHKRAVVVENHLNIIKAENGDISLSLSAINALLNSQVVDRIFRCISGSVAVSAYELNAIPIPEMDEMRELEELLSSRADMKEVANFIQHLYGVG